MLKSPVLFLLLFKVLFIFVAMTYAVDSVRANGWDWTVYLTIAVAAYEIIDFIKTINVLRYIKRIKK